MVLKWLTAGEAHGPGLSAMIEGVPAGVRLSGADLHRDLVRFQMASAVAGMPRLEIDRVEIRAGVRAGETLGGPIALWIGNQEFAKRDVGISAETHRGATPPLTQPRPGAADLPGAIKYDRRDVRDVAERASARETIARVALGAVARHVLSLIEVEVLSHVIRIGNVAADPATATWERVRDASARDELRCADAAASVRMRQAIDAASTAGDTLGGTIELLALNVPIGLGSYVQWDQHLGARLAQGLLSIPFARAIEVGDGIWAATQRGSHVHDPIVYESDDAEGGRFLRARNAAGGIEGGMTNGAPVVVRVALAPSATLRQAVPTVDLETRELAAASVGRWQTCAVPAASLVGEAMMTLLLADAALAKFGGDTARDFTSGFRAYSDRVRRF
jgi:chorismate synthase